MKESGIPPQCLSLTINFSAQKVSVRVKKLLHQLLLNYDSFNHHHESHHKALKIAN